jgi:predicted transposase YdaD
LRTNVEHQLEKAMQSVSTFFKEENDIFYRNGEQRGEQRGEKKKAHAVVKNLLTKLGVSDEKAAEIAEVSIEYVKEIRASLDTKK